MTPGATGGAVNAREFLTFTLGGEKYGIDALKVREIRGYGTVTAIPDTPKFVMGVIKLRDEDVPIIDMRIKLNLERADFNLFTVVIILNVAGRAIGMVVDGVSDVIHLAPGQIRPAPESVEGFDRRHVVGIGTVRERTLILIDIEGFMASRDMAPAMHAMEQ